MWKFDLPKSRGCEQQEKTAKTRDKVVKKILMSNNTKTDF